MIFIGFWLCLSLVFFGALINRHHVHLSDQIWPSFVGISLLIALVGKEVIKTIKMTKEQ